MKMEQPKAKELMTLLTIYMINARQYINVTKKNGAYRYNGIVNSHSKLHSHFLTLLAEVEIVTWQVYVSDNSFLEKRRVFYENGQMFVEKRLEEVLYHNDALQHGAFLDFKKVIERCKPKKSPYYTFKSEFPNKYSYKQFFEIVTNSSSIEDLDCKIKKIVGELKEEAGFSLTHSRKNKGITELARAYLNFKPREIPKGDNEKEEEDLFKIRITLDGKYSYPSEEKTNMVDYINEMKKEEMACMETFGVRPTEKRKMEIVKISYDGEVIFDDVPVTIPYIKSLGLENGLNNCMKPSENEVLISHQGDWVKTCDVCVYRLRREVSRLQSLRFQEYV